MVGADKGIRSPLACCSDLYELDLVRDLLGDSLHPGGLALTRSLAKTMGLSAGQALLDVACGPGRSPIMLAQTYKCHVTGVDLSRKAVGMGQGEAQRYRLKPLTTFLTGDASCLPFSRNVFDAVLCECSLTLFPDDQKALAEMARTLKSGGRLGLSDVTFVLDALPPALDFLETQAMCIPFGTGPEKYTQAMESVGLTVEQATDCSQTILPLLEDIRAKLGLVAAFAKDGGQESGHRLEETIAVVKELVGDGKLGYWTFVARKISQ